MVFFQYFDLVFVGCVQLDYVQLGILFQGFIGKIVGFDDFVYVDFFCWVVVVCMVFRFVIMCN